MANLKSPTGTADMTLRIFVCLFVVVVVVGGGGGGVCVCSMLFFVGDVWSAST